MAKSIRAKINKKFRRELRNTIGKADQEKKEAKVQAELKKAIETQQGSSLSRLKYAIGSTKTPMVTETPDESMMEGEGGADVAMMNTEVSLLKQNNRKNHQLKKKTAFKAGKKKFVHFHTLRKKGA